VTDPVISVVIPTRNRRTLLSGMLESLRAQSLPNDEFEIIVVDDGSTDETPAFCFSLAEEDVIRYRRVTSGGIGQAKNFGLLAAKAPLVLFVDDDDVAAPDLLERHIEIHGSHQDDYVAVLGFTTWAPWLKITPLMKHVTEVGRQLFAYPLPEEEPLSFHHFWGGRSSCKRQFLLDHGIFNPDFTSIIEDVELAYRLVPARLTVLHTRRAVTHMARSLSFAEFCDRSERRGRALALFAALHPEPAVEDFCDTADAVERWNAVEPVLPQKVARVRELERRPDSAESLAELHALYRCTFDAFQLKGIAEWLPGWTA
jgi:glycosyltransferase involved in cell wall biosynthesis